MIKNMGKTELDLRKDTESMMMRKDFYKICKIYPSYIQACRLYRVKGDFQF